MSVIREMYCTVCGAETEDVCDAVAVLPCSGCRAFTMHADCCRGGTGKRFRQQDWPDDPHWEGYAGQCSVVGATVENDQCGNTTSVDERFIEGTDKRNERRDRHYHKDRAKRGKLPIWQLPLRNE